MLGPCLSLFGPFVLTCLPKAQEKLAAELKQRLQSAESEVLAAATETKAGGLAEVSPFFLKH